MFNFNMNISMKNILFEICVGKGIMRRDLTLYVEERERERRGDYFYPKHRSNRFRPDSKDQRSFAVSHLILFQDCVDYKP